MNRKQIKQQIIDESLYLEDYYYWHYYEEDNDWSDSSEDYYDYTYRKLDSCDPFLLVHHLPTFDCYKFYNHYKIYYSWLDREYFQNDPKPSYHLFRYNIIDMDSIYSVEVRRDHLLEALFNPPLGDTEPNLAHYCHNWNCL